MTIKPMIPQAAPLGCTMRLTFENNHSCEQTHQRLTYEEAESYYLGSRFVLQGTILECVRVERLEDTL